MKIRVVRTTTFDGNESLRLNFSCLIENSIIGRDEKRNLRFPCIQWERKRNFVYVPTVYKGNANFVFRPWLLVSWPLFSVNAILRGRETKNGNTNTVVNQNKWKLYDILSFFLTTYFIYAKFGRFWSKSMKNKILGSTFWPIVKISVFFSCPWQIPIIGGFVSFQKSQHKNWSF